MNPTPDLLRELIRHEPDTGKLYWRKDDRPALATICNTTGYLFGRCKDHMFTAHRLIWALHYGEWPADEIDHINGNRADNRISNLRAVSCGENRRNQKMPKTNKSGFVGVFWRPDLGKFCARIRTDRKEIFLGAFNTKEEAIEARKLANIKFNFHENHGRAENPSALNAAPA